MSALAKGNAFKEKDSHLRKAVVGGSNYNVTCYIGFYTLRCMKMESKKKKKVQEVPSHHILPKSGIQL